MAIFFISCSTEVEVLTDLSGTYTGEATFYLEGQDANESEELEISISKTSDLDYLIDLGDDFIVTAKRTESGLDISTQTLGEGQDFDRATVEGTILEKTEGLQLDLTFLESSDDIQIVRATALLIKI